MQKASDSGTATGQGVWGGFFAAAWFHEKLSISLASDLPGRSEFNRSRDSFQKHVPPLHPQRRHPMMFSN